jgi:quercetin dioxygenase-like cupin family protein
MSNEKKATKTEGAYKAGNGSYFFDVAKLSYVNAGRNYADTYGSVVEGELTQVGIMTIPAGMSSDPHTHPNEQWIYLLKGRILAVIDGQKREVKPGELLFIPANVVHNVDVLPEADAHFFTCKDMRHGIAGTPVGAERRVPESDC